MSELAEARCTDPDHHAINAERSEARGLRKAWIKLDDQRQTLERELAEVTKQRDAAFQLIEYAGELIGVTPQEHKSAHGFAVLQAIKDLTHKQP